jgi:DNA-binding PadR family transcriptional regulator
MPRKPPPKTESLDNGSGNPQHVDMRHVAPETEQLETTPLTEPVFLVLLSLVQAPRHGYALLKDTEALSDGRVRLSTGTLYGVIHRLLESKWIERFETDDTSRDKQSYRLTSLGRKFLQAELARMKQLTRAATACLKSREA